MSVNNPVIDEQEDGIYIYVTEMPDILLNVKIDYPPLSDYEDDED